MNFRVISVILCIAGYSYASWLCPVYRTDSSGLIEEESSEIIPAKDRISKKDENYKNTKHYVKVVRIIPTFR